jgi:hypothetical protein
MLPFIATLKFLKGLSKLDQKIMSEKYFFAPLEMNLSVFYNHKMGKIVFL